ncbi:hypothetical protein NA57DRAFT_48287 [Rhizodiscina lignyota]|uniref:Uncharacterized protein n=1 Tax=Rhizodiscina lignyota TaxID=1504668 RepID=A0A9P4I6K7_9PEZI|nr:hypothetical protein NA57DRAFT_48287 [Rhizodiscina lignyota]
MADSNPATAADEAPEPQVTINVKSGSDQKHVFTLPLSTTIGDLKSKLSSSEYADLPADRQRLIFSGRILKDHDTLEQVKVKDGHTIHLVKSAASNARQNPASSPSAGASSAGTTPTPAVPTNIAAGTGNSPFAQLTGARHAGFHGLPGAEMFGPDGGMGAPPDPEAMLGMLDDPMFVSQMNEMMNNPAMIQMLLNSPHVRNNPQARMMLQNPEFRRLMLNPEMLRMQLQMQRAMDGMGGGGFAMPGETDTTAQTGTGNAGETQTEGQNGQQQPQNPFAMFGQGQGGQANPFAALFNPPSQQPGTTPATSPPNTASAGQGTPAQPTPSGQEGQNQVNPFASLFGGQTGDQQDNAFARMTQQMMQNPEMMRMAMQAATGMMNPQNQTPGSTDANTGAAGQQNPFAGLFNPMAFGAGGMGALGAPEPPDSRPPEERYADQLRQLNDMGFYEFDRNVQALRRSGGSVQGAVEYLLSNP